jgi:hypothetical protein
MLRTILLIFCTAFALKGFTQDSIIVRSIHWTDNKVLDNGKLILSFTDAVYPDMYWGFPYFKEQFELPFFYKLSITDISYEKLDTSISNNINRVDDLPDTFQVSTFRSSSRKRQIIKISLLPVYRNKITSEVFRMKSFTIIFKIDPTLKNSTYKEYLSHSVLQNGLWYKIKLNIDGVYKITYSQLKKMGFENPGNVRIYGNGGGMLPKRVNIDRPDDLRENAVFYVDGNDGTFNEGDYVLFYGQGPNVWHCNNSNNHYYHSQDKFSDYNYYFLTDYYGRGFTIADTNDPLTNYNVEVITYDDYSYHENDRINLFKSGAEWYGEQLTNNIGYSTSFEFSNIDNASPAFFYYSFIARASSKSYFTIKIAESTNVTPDVQSVNKSNSERFYANAVGGGFIFYPSSGSIPLDLSYICQNDPDGQGYINYYGINVRRKLKYNQSQMHFRDIESVGLGNVAKFSVTGANTNLSVWDVTDVCIPKSLRSNISGDILSFTASASVLRQFVLFDKTTGLLQPVLEGDDIGKIENQDIHSATTADLIIIAPQDTGIIRQAKRLADFRKLYDGYRVFLTTTDQIYNEFSSGKKSVTALRDMIRLFYDRALQETDIPRYVLLFGKGTFDNKTKNENNYNLIPTYQSDNSLNQSESYVTDDFFGWMNDTVDDPLNLLDIGVGRLPVKNSLEAEEVVDKILNYENPSSMGDWRNYVCFIGDDEDNNVHVSQSDSLARMVGRLCPNFIVQKIFFDSYPEITTTVGNRYPDVNTAINNRINQGALLVNYTGHGNENQLAHEVVINKPSIMSWTNKNKLPLFITATCEFSRFDDVNILLPGEKYEDRTSGGEEILLNPQGGGIALLTTTRLVYSSDNNELNIAFYEYAFSKDYRGYVYRIGDANRLAKNKLVDNNNTSTNRLNFTLLGDPSMMLAYPKKLNIITDSINGISIETGLDTLKALSLARISGHVQDDYGSVLTDYNGTLGAVVFDKETSRTTLANHFPDNTKFSYLDRENTVFKGYSNIIDGMFSFSFPIPKDINYNLGTGKISYYSDNGIYDIAGSTEKFIIGDLSDSIDFDNVGPVIQLFINDTNYREKDKLTYGITNQNPQLLVKLFDENGINITGVGIGHDISALIDNDIDHIISLNDYYRSEINDFRRGTVLYPLYGLTPGDHVLKVIAWDIYNNSSIKEIKFTVVSNNNLMLQNVYNYPNPFSYQTNFVFEFNMPDELISVEIRIFSISGQLVNILRTSGPVTGFRSAPMSWNGRDGQGRQAQQGLYLYKIKVSSGGGKSAESYGKMVIVRPK